MVSVTILQVEMFLPDLINLSEGFKTEWELFDGDFFQSFLLIMAARIRVKNTKAINMAPNTDCENINAGSELRVAVEGRHPKYAAKKMPPKTAPTLWAENNNLFICLSLNLN